MAVRRQRVHQTGKSNRRRAHKAPDITAVLKKAPSVVSVSDEQSVATWVRQVDIFRPPTAVRTKLGGTYIRESSQCNSRAYLPILSDVLSPDDDSTKNLLQPQWNTAQPQLGVPIWSSESMQNKPYATDGENISEGVGPANFMDNSDMNPAGIPTDVWSL